jgi:hypothetical protein
MLEVAFKKFISFIRIKPVLVVFFASPCDLRECGYDQITILNSVRMNGKIIMDDIFSQWAKFTVMNSTSDCGEKDPFLTLYFYYFTKIIAPEDLDIEIAHGESCPE